MHVGMDVLEPLQEAWLDASAPTRPWTPDLYATGNLLAAEHGEAQVCMVMLVC